MPLNHRKLHKVDQSLIVKDMQVFLLILLLTSCRWRELVVTTSPVILQVVEGQILQLSRLDAKISKCLRVLVNDLVKALHLKLIRAAHWPPDNFVEGIEYRCKKSLWHVDVATAVDNFSVDYCSDLSHAVISRTEQLESLSGGCVVVANLLERCTNIDGLGIS